MKNKKGVSILIGYVLLIVIAISLSVLVFNYLKVIIPKDKPECSSDIGLIIQNASCNLNSKTLSLTIQNKGLFSADAVFIRMAPSSRKVRLWLNDYENEDFNIDFFTQFRFCTSSTPENPETECSLSPSSSKTFTLPLSYEDLTSQGEYTIEIQPAEYINDEAVICENSIITQTITCLKQ